MKRYYQRNLSTAHKVSLVAMFSAMSIIVLYLSALLPTGTIGFYFLSSIFVGGMLVERKPGSAFAVYVVVSLLALILLPGSPVSALPYILLFGHYGRGKYFIEHIGDKVIAFLIKLLYFNVFMAAVYLLAGSTMFGAWTQGLPFWVIIAAVQVVFVIFDFLYSKLVLYYENVIRPKLIKR